MLVKPSSHRSSCVSLNSGGIDRSNRGETTHIYIINEIYNNLRLRPRGIFILIKISLGICDKGDAY